jgi:hypothetical protein
MQLSREIVTQGALCDPGLGCVVMGWNLEPGTARFGLTGEATAVHCNIRRARVPARVPVLHENEKRAGPRTCPF